MGNLQETSPHIITEILGETPQFDTSLDEISAVMHKLHGEIYADKQALAQDLAWLTANGINSHSHNLAAALENIDIEADSKQFIRTIHPHSDLETFTRLIKLIRYIIHGEPLDITEEAILKAETLSKKLPDDEIQKKAPKKKTEGLQIQTNQRFIVKMIDEEILPLTENKIKNKRTNTDEGYYIDNIVRYYSNLKDTEFSLLRKFQILPEYEMKKGYYFGTALLPKNELNDIFNLLLSQSQKDNFTDPSG